MTIQEYWKETFHDLRAYLPSYVILKFIEPEDKVLIVGDSGRDYYSLKKKGINSKVMDIARQSMIPDEAFVYGDVQEKIPFSDKSFDKVVLFKVLEHIFYDIDALKEIRRVLKKDGRLLLSTPFYVRKILPELRSDYAEYHVRINSKKTLKRILSASGFETEYLVTRGFLLTFSPVFKKLSEVISGISGKDYFVTNILAKLAYFVGSTPLEFLNRGKFYGCYLVAKKSKSKDYKRINITEFER